GTHAMMQYRAALQLAPNDPELARAIAELSETVTRSANERENVRARSLLAALERWLAGVHVTRAQRSACTASSPCARATRRRIARRGRRHVAGEHELPDQ